MAFGYTIQALDIFNIFATAFGRAYASTDSGITWKDITPQATHMHDVWFVTPSLGWGAGTGLFKTSDGGRTWIEQDLSLSNTSVNTVRCSSATEGLVGCGAGLLFRTDDGTNWSPVHSGLTGTVTRIRLAAQKSAWAVVRASHPTRSEIQARAYQIWRDRGQLEHSELQDWFDAEKQLTESGGVIHTIDGGLTWTVVGAFVNATEVAVGDSCTVFVLENPDVRDSPMIYVVLGDLYRSNDGGRSWSIMARPDGFAMRFVSPSFGWNAGYVNSRGCVARTINGGVTWESIGLATNAACDLDAIGVSHVWVIAGSYGGPCVLRSIDGGVTWGPPSMLS